MVLFLSHPQDGRTMSEAFWQDERSAIERAAGADSLGEMEMECGELPRHPGRHEHVKSTKTTGVIEERS